MLIAEIHGKSCQAARDSEDYLTSAVFGHLRYVPPTIFWNDLFSHARGLSALGGREPSLSMVLSASGQLPSSYDRLSVHFWRAHPDHGEPDLVLTFIGSDQPALVLIIEAKLWARKSDTGEYDQLARYLRVLDDLDGAGVTLPADTARFLVYLTPRESLPEVEDSIPRDRPPRRLQVLRA